MASELRRVRSKDPVLEQLQQNVADSLAELRSSPVVASHLLTGPHGAPLELVSGQANFIDHGMGKRVRWLLVSPSVDCRVWEAEADEVLPTKVLALRTSATVKCFILVFPA